MIKLIMPICLIFSILLWRLLFFRLLASLLCKNLLIVIVLRLISNLQLLLCILRAIETSIADWKISASTPINNIFLANIWVESNTFYLCIREIVIQAIAVLNLCILWQLWLSYVWRLYRRINFERRLALFAVD